MVKGLLERLMQEEHPTKANRYSTRDLLTLTGPLENLKVPQVREGDFHPKILPYRRRTSLEFSEAILGLYATGVNTRALCRFLEEIYGAFYLPQSIPRLTQVGEEDKAGGSAPWTRSTTRCFWTGRSSPSAGGKLPRSRCTSPWA